MAPTCSTRPWTESHWAMRSLKLFCCQSVRTRSIWHVTWRHPFSARCILDYKHSVSPFNLSQGKRKVKTWRTSTLNGTAFKWERFVDCTNHFLFPGWIRKLVLFPPTIPVKFWSKLHMQGYIIFFLARAWVLFVVVDIDFILNTVKIISKEKKLILCQVRRLVNLKTVNVIITGKKSLP